MPSPVKLTRVAPTRLQDAPMFLRHLRAERCAAVSRSPARLASQEHLHSAIARHMIERRKFVKRKTPVILDVGTHSGWFLRHMLDAEQEGAGGLATRDWGVRQYIQTDVSEEALDNLYNDVKHKLPPEIELVQICCDEEQNKPFELPDRSVDMVVSCLSANWINQLENTMINIRNVLRRDGFLLLSMFGGNTLYELRSAFSLADVECKGGVSPHVSPFVDGAGISSLILQSGFTLPSIDMDRFVLSYKDAFQLCEHLQSMGETACHMTGAGALATSNRTTLAAMASVYDAMYRKNGRVPATFEVFHSVAWSPSPTQPQPLERGSGEISMTSVGGKLHKEFSKAMAESARSPNDKELQAKADRLYQELKVEMEKEQLARTGGSSPSSNNDFMLPQKLEGDDVPMAAVGNVAGASGSGQGPPITGTMVTDLQQRVKEHGFTHNKPLPPGETAAEGKADEKKENKAEEEKEEQWQQFEAFMAASGVNNPAPGEKK